MEFLAVKKNFNNFLLQNITDHALFKKVLSVSFADPDIPTQRTSESHPSLETDVS